MNPIFWRRLPMFATGSLLGIAFAVVYVQQRMIASSVKPLDDFQKNIGEVPAGQKFQFHFRLDKNWVWHNHFPCTIALLRDPGNGLDRQELQRMEVQTSEELMGITALPEGNYLFRADVVECKPGEKRPLCFGQMQYYFFRSATLGKQSIDTLDLAPQNLPIPR